MPLKQKYPGSFLVPVDQKDEGVAKSELAFVFSGKDTVRENRHVSSALPTGSFHAGHAWFNLQPIDDQAVQLNSKTRGRRKVLAPSKNIYVV